MTPSSFDTARSVLGWVATALMPVAWVVLYLDLQAARIQEVVGPRGLPLEYAAGRAELLSNELVTGAIEVGLLILVLQPWRRGLLWARAMAAFALFLPWTILAFAIGMHAGPIGSTHTEWRLIILGVIGVVMVVSGLFALVGHHRKAV